MKKLSDVLNGLPPINFQSKKENLIQYVTIKFPDNKEALDIILKFKKSPTVTFPHDFPLSKDFLETIYSIDSDEELLAALKKRFQDQINMIKRDIETILHLFNQNSSYVLSDLVSIQKIIEDGNLNLNKTDIDEIEKLILQLQKKLKMTKEDI